MKKARQLTLAEDPRFVPFVERYAFDIPRFAIEALGMVLVPDQLELMDEAQEPGCRVSVSSGHGCFGLGTPIMRATGAVVPVEDVRVGDRLMGPDGSSSRTVLELKRGREALYRFTYSDGTSHIFNESHILCLVATNSKGLRVAGQRITVTVREWLTWGADKRRCHAAYRQGVTHFQGSAQALPVPPYILGAWLGDGNSADHGFTSADEEIVEAFGAYATSMNCTLVDRRSKICGAARTYAMPMNGVRSRWHPHPILDKLRELRVLGNKHIPERYLTASLDDRLQLLAGLLDTDGHLDAGSGGFEFTQKCGQLAHQVAWLARSVGCHATLKQSEKTCCNTGAKGLYWRVTIGRNVSIIPVRLARKKPPTIDRQRNNLHFSIRSCEPIGAGEYYGFVLDGDSRFLGGDFTVLHNTGKTASYGVIAIWHLLCYFNSNTIITAPKLATVHDGVWKEFSDIFLKLQAGPHAWICDYFTIESERVYVKGFKLSWWIVCKTAPRGSPENLAGAHRDWLLWLVDEASGVPDANFGVIGGSLTDARNRMVCASQPTRPAGAFYDQHHSQSKYRGGAWTNLTFNSENSPLVSDQFLAQKLNEYGGRHDPQYQIKVMGRFPENLEGQLLSRTTLEGQIGIRSCIPAGAEFGHLVLVDVGAGEYRDKSVISVVKVWQNGAQHEDDARRVHVVRLPVVSNTIQPTALGAEVLHVAGGLSNATVLIDGGGLGLGVYKRLLELGMTNVVKVLWGNPCFKTAYKESFFNQRSQAMVTIARAVKAGHMTWAEDCFIDSRHKTEMLDQGSRIPYHFDDKARYVIESKRSKAWEGLPSPDIWDSLSFAFLEDATYIPSDADGLGGSAPLVQGHLDRLAELMAADLGG